MLHAGSESTRLSAFGAGCDPLRSTFVQRMRAAAALKAPISRVQAVIGMAMETGPWTAGSVTLREPGCPVRTFAYLDAHAADCDRLQTDLGEGPAYDVVHVGVVHATNLATEPRWPRWSPAAVRLGMRRTLALRLFVNSTSGTLSLYAPRPGDIETRMIRDAEALAAYASMLLGAIVSEDQLRKATSTRGLIGQAQGILMQKYGITADAAFAVLRRTSQHHNVKLVTIAEQLISTGAMPGLGLPPPI